MHVTEAHHPGKCSPLWRASHFGLEARREENKAHQQQSGRGGARDASPVTGSSWQGACLGEAGAAAPLLSAAGVRASRASPWVVAAGGGPRCKASDRLRLARSCRLAAANQRSRCQCRVRTGGVMPALGMWRARSGLPFGRPSGSVARSSPARRATPTTLRYQASLLDCLRDGTGAGVGHGSCIPEEKVSEMLEAVQELASAGQPRWSEARKSRGR